MTRVELRLERHHHLWRLIEVYPNGASDPSLLVSAIAVLPLVFDRKGTSFGVLRRLAFQNAP